jgi:hypothetical protein
MANRPTSQTLRWCKQQSEITRLVKATVPEYCGWDGFFDYWANWTLSLPADLQAALAPVVFIKAVCDHDTYTDKTKPGGKSRKEIQTLLVDRLQHFNSLKRSRTKRPEHQTPARGL